jgi:RNA 2',3'-cyclic 3'-phosphodiesterase
MNSKDTLRLFLAIQIPEFVRTELQRLQEELKPLLPAKVVHWAKPEQFHLTLKFLGYVPVGEVAALSEAARAVCAEASPLSLRAEGVGFFPNNISPRVFWVEIKSADNRLRLFQKQLEVAVQRFAEKEEAKKFAAHVTVARFEKWRRGSVEKFMMRVPKDRRFGEWTAREVELVESKLRQAGALHAILDTFSTKNS